jgi:hypothetical protein
MLDMSERMSVHPERTGSILVFVTSVDDSRFSDAARRVSDLVSFHVTFGNSGRWVAVRLLDGGSDGVLYDLKADAVRHQLHETLCAYIKIPPDGMTPRAAERFLDLNRLIYDAGYRISDPDQEVYPVTMMELPR